MATHKFQVPPEVAETLKSLGISVPDDAQAAAALIQALLAASKAAKKANKSDDSHEIRFAVKDDGSRVARISTGKRGKPVEITTEMANVVVNHFGHFQDFVGMDFDVLAVEVRIGEKTLSQAECAVLVRQGSALLAFADGEDFAACEAARVDPPKSDDAE